MPLRSYLMAIAIFANEVKGKSMLALSRDLGTQYKTAFVLAHKMREAMGSEVSKFEIGGDGKSAEIDGGYFGGYVKPANRRENRRDRRLRENRSGKRRVVVIIRERGGEALPGVFRSEAEAVTFIRATVLPKATLYADEASAWDDLHARYELHRINHQESYSLGGEKAVHTNSAEAFFSRMRRGEIGHHHHVAGPYLIRFAEKLRGARHTSAFRTARRLTGSSGWRCAISPAPISAATGSGAGRHERSCDFQADRQTGGTGPPRFRS
jgi:hypothetical protein